MLVGRFSFFLLLLATPSLAQSLDGHSKFAERWDAFKAKECQDVSILKQKSEAFGDRWTMIKDPDVISYLKGMYAVEFKDYPSGSSAALIQPKRDDDWSTDFILFIDGNTSCAFDTFIDEEGAAISAIKKHGY